MTKLLNIPDYDLKYKRTKGTYQKRLQRLADLLRALGKEANGRLNDDKFEELRDEAFNSELGFCMDSWHEADSRALYDGTTHDGQHYRAVPEITCGTTFCIAGWATAVNKDIWLGDDKIGVCCDKGENDCPNDAEWAFALSHGLKLQDAFGLVYGGFETYEEAAFEVELLIDKVVA